jgi:uncharacterized membrane protein YcaP (DUF421 family)
MGERASGAGAERRRKAQRVTAPRCDAQRFSEEHMNSLTDALFDNREVLNTAAKTSALFLTAAVFLRFTERRTLAEFAPFDWVAAVAVGAIVGRSATATDTSWLAAAAALICLLLTHAVVARLRFVPIVRKFIDPPPQVLIRDGRIDSRSLRRCGLTVADLDAVLRQHGMFNADQIHLAVFEAKGAISVLPARNTSARRPTCVGDPGSTSQRTTAKDLAAGAT